MRPLMRMLLLSVMLAVASQVGPIRAELILDDFVDAAETFSPELEEESILTEHVGALEATRSFRIAGTASAATPSIARLDADVSSESRMTAHLSTPGAQRSGSAPLFAFQFDFIFAPTDVTQGDRNNAILIDFERIQGNGYVPELGLIVRDDFNRTESFFSAIRDLPVVSGPFTAAIPFSSFTQRGGAPGLPDFTTMRRMDFDFFFLYPAVDVQWSAEIDRIRFGRIPEPSSIQLLCIAAIYVASKASRGLAIQRRMRSWCVKPCRQ